MKSILDIGQMLRDAKVQLPHGEFGEMVDKDLPFGERTVQRLMAVAAHSVMSNTTYVSLLPNSWSTLYELTKVPLSVLEEALVDGRIHPDMERKDVRELLPFYNETPVKDREMKKKELAAILSVSERTVRDWLSRIDKDTKEKQRKQAFDLWLSCHTHEEIAEQVGWARPEVTKNVPNGDFAEWNKIDESRTNENDDTDSPLHLTKAQLAAAKHATDFNVPLYNVWKQQEKTEGSKHFGNSEVRWEEER